MCLSIISFIVIILLCDKQPVVVVAIKYEPNWNSLDKRPLPLWYDEAKVGIFIHWGIYTVPSMGTEWFWTNWQNQKLENYVEFMKKNYKPNYTYQDFAHDFTAELFNATQWAELFKDAGARYVVFVSKHHDGYCLWPSAYSFGWNSMDVGPKRDVLGELSIALRKNTKLKFGVYYSLFEWFNRLYLNDKLHGFRKQDYVDLKMHPEQRQLIEEYQPEIIWSDGDWEASDIYWKSTEFLAWLYNDSPVRSTVVVNDRWGNGTACRHGGFYNCHDRYNPHHLLEHKWENCLTLDTQSWGQRFDVTLNNFITPEELIRQVVTTISCNGNVLVNVAPTKYGTIMPIFEERLRQMGEWLRINADAIYATKPWVIQNDTLQPDVWYTSRTNKNRKADNILNIYAIVLKYPYDSNAITLKPWSHLIEDPRVTLFGIEEHLMNLNDKIISVVMLGIPDTTIKWQVKNSSLYITFPLKRHIDRAGLKYAWTFQIVMDTK